MDQRMMVAAADPVPAIAGTPGIVQPARALPASVAIGPCDLPHSYTPRQLTGPCLGICHTSHVWAFAALSLVPSTGRPGKGLILNFGTDGTPLII